MLRKVYFIILVATVCYGRHFKFDYFYNKLIDGWLKLHLVPTTFNDARLRCHARGDVLASPLTPKLRYAIIEQMNSQHQPVPAVFIGIHSVFAKGVYTSIEGVPLTKIPIDWAPNEPNNLNDSENCLAMNKNGTVKDVRCDDSLPYVCYKQKTNKLVVSRCRTFDPEYQLDLRTGSCYKFHSWGQSYSRAFMTCEAEGAYLAIINSDIESEVLKELYAQHPNEKIRSRYPYRLYLGYHEWNSGWMTIHGKTLAEAGYENWNTGEPNNGSNSQPKGEHEPCGIMYREGKMNDITCNAIQPFVCEKSISSDDIDFLI